MIETDVCIIGAGPGGCSSAMFLDKMGISSILVDKESFPRDKICGDGLSGWVLSTLNKLDPEINYTFSKTPLQVPSWGARFVAPNHKSLDVPFKLEASINNDLPAGFVSKRIHFDNFLIEEVKKRKNIRLIENTEINGFEKSNNGVLLSDISGKSLIKTKLVIFANGAHSKFSKNLANIHMEKKHYVAGIRTYYEGITEIHDSNYIELHFLKELLPGYFWIFPLPNGQANVGLGMRSDKISKKGINLKKKLYQVINHNTNLKKRFQHAKEIDPPRGFGLPLGSKKRNISGDNFMLVGDAASLIDPFTGEGIGNAMASGMYAAIHAKKCINANDYSAAFMKGYDNYTYSKLGKELQLSKAMQDLLNFPSLFSFIVNKAIKNKTLRDTISSMLTDMEVREQLKKPSFYFKVLFG